MSNSMKNTVESCIRNAIFNSLENAKNDVMRGRDPNKNNMPAFENQLSEETSDSFHHSGKKFIVREQYKNFLPLLRGAVLSVNTYRIPGGETFTRFLKNGKGIGLEISDEIFFLGLKKKQDGKYYLSDIQEKDYQSL
jgi:hypothetical protein